MARRCFSAMGLVLLLAIALALPAWAVPGLLNYQGTLTDSGGNALNGTFSMTFRLFTVEKDGSSFWEETQSVLVVGGSYSVQLGTGNPLNESYFTGDDLYLEVVAEGETLVPRLRLTSTAFAMKAGVAESVADGAVATSMLADGAVDTAKVADNAVTAGKIADGTVTAADIRDGEVLAEILDDDGTGSGLDADLLDGYSLEAFFKLNENEVVTGLPTFTGGKLGASPPFTVGSTELVSNLNADYLDGFNSSAFFRLNIDQTVTGRPAFNGGVSGTSSPFTVNSKTVVQNLNADLLQGKSPTAFASSTHSHHSLNASDGSPTNALYVNSAGNVGIGTTTPVKPLTIRTVATGTPASSQLRLEEGSSRGWEFWGGSDLQILDDGVSRIMVTNSGRVGIGTTAPGAKLDVRGDVHIEGNVTITASDTGETVMELGKGLDYAEGFDVSEYLEEEINPGAVLVIDPMNPGKLVLSTEAYDTKVAGIVAGANGIGSGVKLGAGQFDREVALAGRVYCNVDATEVGVEPGDMLTTSSTPGYAQKSTDCLRAQGAILGKAMQRLEKGQKGQILVLVTLQ